MHCEPVFSDHIDSIPPPPRAGVITTSSLINGTDLFSANEFVDSLLQDMVFRLSMTPYVPFPDFTQMFNKRRHIGRISG